MDDLCTKTGLQLKIALKGINQTFVDSPHRWYSVEASIADASLPLGQALKQHQEAKEAQAKDVQQRTQEAKAAYERIKIAIATELPQLLAGGMEWIEIPALRFQDGNAIERSHITSRSIE